jgi:hypothetical protein
MEESIPQKRKDSLILFIVLNFSINYLFYNLNPTAESWWLSLYAIFYQKLYQI